VIEPLFSLKETLPLFVVIPILAGVLSNFLYKRTFAVKALASLGMIALVALPFFTAYDENYYVFGAHPEVGYFLGEGVANAFNLGIAYQYTQVQMVILLAFAVMTALSVGVALVLRERVSGVYLFLMLMAISTACAVALVDDIFNLFVFFEICTVSQAGIVAWLHDDDAFRTSLKYMLLGSVAGGMLLLGVAFLLGSTGVLNISDMYEMFTQVTQREAPMIFMGLALLIFAWTYGGGLPPFHIIKSELYGRASPEAGAVLQAISKVLLIGLGIIIIRLFYWQDVTWQAMLVISTFAMMIGGAMAMVQNDFRRLIAYVAVNQAGIVGIGLSFFRRLPVMGSTGYMYAWGHEGMAYGVYHGFNEIIVTSALFIGAAGLMYAFGHTRMSEIRGLAQRNREFAVLLLVSMLAVSGLPPLNCFQSEWRLIQFAFAHGFMVIGLLMVVSTVMVFYALAKAFVVMFLRPLPLGEKPKPMELPFAITLALMAAIVLEVFFGLFPELAIDPITAGLTALFGG
jgi:energy-converting hydrogenase B subunit F